MRCGRPQLLPHHRIRPSAAHQTCPSAHPTPSALSPAWSSLRRRLPRSSRRTIPGGRRRSPGGAPARCGRRADAAGPPVPRGPQLRPPPPPPSRIPARLSTSSASAVRKGVSFRYKVFMRFLSKEEHEAFVRSVIEERKIWRRIQDLQECCSAGCHTLAEGTIRIEQKRKKEYEMNAQKAKESGQLIANSKAVHKTNWPMKIESDGNLNLKKGLDFGGFVANLSTQLRHWRLLQQYVYNSQDHLSTRLRYWEPLQRYLMAQFHNRSS